MTPPLEFRAWHKEWAEQIRSDDELPKMYSVIAIDWDKEQIELLDEIGNCDWVSISEVQIVQYTGHNSIDDQKVFAGDHLRFPDTEQVYEVRWNNDEGGWGIFYETMNAFKIGMTRFMVLVGNVFEGEKS